MGTGDSEILALFRETPQVGVIERKPDAVADHILDERFPRGQIDTAEYCFRRHVLQAGPELFGPRGR